MRYYALLIVLISASLACAAPIGTWSVVSTVPGGPVNATASLTLNGDSLVVTLTNNLSDPRSASQLVSDVIIMGLTGLVGGPVLDTTVSTSGTYSQLYGSTELVDPGWGFGPVAGGYEICIICPATIQPSGTTAPPSRLIMGIGPDPDGNSSIDTHSPSLGGFAQFTINNVDPNSTITGVTISFGSEGTEIAGTPGGGGTTSSVPEPGAWFMAATGLGLLWLGRGARSKRSRV